MWNRDTCPFLVFAHEQPDLFVCLESFQLLRGGKRKRQKTGGDARFLEGKREITCINSVSLRENESQRGEDVEFQQNFTYGVDKKNAPPKSKH